MKTVHVGAVILAVLVLAGCHKGPNDQAPDGFETMVQIKGAIGSLQKSSDGLSLTDAKSVLVFSKYFDTLVAITNGSFSAPAHIGTGVALIFLDAKNQYIGNLTAHGLNLLPLGDLSQGENTVIDLSTLTLLNGSVIPSHDPIGNEIVISEAEIQSLRVLDAYYESIAKNIDADNDGVPDVLSNKQLMITTMYTINAGHWGINDSIPVLSDSEHYFVNYGIEIGGGPDLTFNYNDIVFSGPAENPYNDIVLWGYLKAPQCGGKRAFIASFNRPTQAPTGAPWGTAFQPFQNGLYTVTLDAERKYTLRYSNIDVQYNLVFIIPTLHTNSSGRLTSISLQYALPDGTPINPTSVLTNVILQCFDTSANMMFQASSNTPGSPAVYSIPVDPPMNISTLNSVGISYDDLIGNQYFIGWH